MGKGAVMAEIEGLDDLAGGVEGLERSLTGATGQAAALTGESLPVRLRRGAEALSGSPNIGEAIDQTATRPAEDRTYAGRVRLVEEVRSRKALEREVKELRRANEILRKASAYFAQAELDRRGT